MVLEYVAKVHLAGLVYDIIGKVDLSPGVVGGPRGVVTVHPIVLRDQVQLSQQDKGGAVVSGGEVVLGVVHLPPVPGGDVIFPHTVEISF